MLSIEMLRTKIRSLLEAGIDKFVIYPFGGNGIAAYKCLVDEFGVTPVAIVDNYYKSNELHIINVAKLRDIYRDNIVLLLTSEKIEQHHAMLQDIQSFIKPEKILDWLSINTDDSTLDKFKLKSWLPDAVSFGSDRHIIKIRIYAGESQHWNTLESFLYACIADADIDVLLLTNEQLIRPVEAKVGVRCKSIKDYAIEEDCPDVFIVSNPYERSVYSSEIRNYTKLIVVVNLALICYQGSVERFCRLLEDGFGALNPDFYLFDSYLYRKMLQHGFHPNKLVEMGNGKYDGIFHALQERPVIPGWKKFDGKQVFLWATDHGLRDNEGKLYVNDDVSFGLYAKDIFKYFHTHQELGLIFRPHPMFIHELLTCAGWTVRDLQCFRSYCEHSPNIVFDESPNYNAAMSYADGILIDAHCGMLASVLPTLKPVCVLHQSQDVVDWAPEITTGYDKAYTFTDLVFFIEKVIKKEDPKYNSKLVAKEQYIKNFDGKNGWRIKEFIKRKYYKLFPKQESYDVCV